MTTISIIRRIFKYPFIVTLYPLWHSPQEHKKTNHRRYLVKDLYGNDLGDLVMSREKLDIGNKDEYFDYGICKYENGMVHLIGGFDTYERLY